MQAAAGLPVATRITCLSLSRSFPPPRPKEEIGGSAAGRVRSCKGRTSGYGAELELCRGRDGAAQADSERDSDLLTHSRTNLGDGQASSRRPSG